MASSRNYRKWFSLSQGCFWALIAVGNLVNAPRHGGYTLSNRLFVVGVVLLAVAVAWFEAYRRYRRPANDVAEWLA